MVKKRLKNPIFLFYILVGYVTVQFAWWLYLIFSLYQASYPDKEELSQKTWMLVGEGTVFLVLLLGGVLMIRRALKREKEINELQENFLQSVSHELKTPIASVGLFLETLKKHELPQEKREDIYDRSLSEIKRLNNLISDILTARNIDSDNYYVHKESIQLDSYLSDKLKTLGETVFKDHQLVPELSPLTADLDKEALDSILYNLLENAAKYSPSGSNIKVTTEQKNGKKIISVADHGEGIDQQTKERVFEKFYRAENESTRKSKGTGLGLYITKFLVEKQGGKIFLKDNQPQGLIVEIQFQ
jgi:two-component system phosphate regulon sensor histidine kinase PhoR